MREDITPYKMTQKEIFKVFLHYIWCSFKNWNPGGFLWPNTTFDTYYSDRYHIARCSCGYGYKFHPLACQNDDFKFENNIPKDHLGLFQNPHIIEIRSFPTHGYNKSVKDGPKLVVKYWIDPPEIKAGLFKDGELPK